MTKKLFAGAEFLVTDPNPADIFTPEDFTEEHRLIRDTARDFVKDDIEPNAERIDAKEEGVALGLFAKAGELGLLGTDVPEEYGGLGLDKVSTTIVTEAFGNSGSFAGLHGAHTGIGTLPIVWFGTEAHKQKYLAKLASGEWIGAYCLTESGSGSDALAAKAKAVLSADGKHYILNGEKIFITNAGWANTFVVYAKVDGDKFTGFLIEAGTPGLTTGREEHKLGMHGSSTRTVILEDVKVPVENVLYEVGKGHKIAFNVLNIGRWKLGAGSLGGAKGAINGSIQYAKQRIQFDRPIASFGMIRAKIADMTMRTYAAESAVYRLAGMLDDRMATLSAQDKKNGEKLAKAVEEYAVECSIAKVLGSEVLSYCCDEYVQILGGYGYITEYPAERYYRDSRINRIWEGTNEINRMLIPGTILRRAMEGRVNLLGAAQAVAKELIEFSPMGVQIPDEPLGLQGHCVKMMKKIALMLAGLAAQKYGPKLSEEQEILAGLADTVMDIFAAESAVLRTRKIIATVGADKAKGQIAATELFIDTTLPILEQRGKRLLTHMEKGDMLRTQLAGLRKLAKYQPIDAIDRSRIVADLVTERECYPF
ncbi:MAG: acyl-CoA dehydrogenase family protein [Myxococcota bacterium]|nr:acyl-CoA dehydrogenase family protein [Myxococcota bacterium]